VRRRLFDDPTQVEACERSRPGFGTRNAGAEFADDRLSGARLGTLHATRAQ
jgi:hypothetical protein